VESVTAAETVHARGEEVVLQPQPLPPVERFDVAAAVMTHRFVRLVIESEIQRRPASLIVSDMVDDLDLWWHVAPPTA
jgi:hypothetical protein